MKNCKVGKQIKELEVYGNSVQDGTPTPENPIEVSSIGEKTNNIYHKGITFFKNQGWNIPRESAVITDSSISAYADTTAMNGSLPIYIGDASDFAGKTLCMSFIPKSDLVNTIYTGLMVVNSSWTTVVSSDSKEWEGGYYNSITIPENPEEGYRVAIRLYGKNFEKGDEISIEDIMICEGTKPLAYEPYGKYKIPIVQNNFNIKNNILIEGAFSNNVNTIYENGEYTFTRTEEFPNRFSGWFNINLPAGSKLYCRYNVIETTCAKAVNVLAEHIDGSTTTMSLWSYSSLASVVISKDVVRLRMYLDNNEAIGSYTKFRNLVVSVNERPMLEKQEHNIYLDEPLRKVGIYADYIDFKNQKVIRNVYENVLSSVDRDKYIVSIIDIDVPAIRFQYRVTYPQYYFPTSDGLQVSYYALCNRYPVVSTGKRGDITVSGSTSTMNSFDIADSDYTTLDEWDAYLQRLYNEGTPLKLIHAIKNPIEEDISCQLPKITAKTTVFTVDSAIEPSNMNGKYIK